jgi:hypothetical protein
MYELKPLFRKSSARGRFQIFLEREGLPVVREREAGLHLPRRLAEPELAPRAKAGARDRDRTCDPYHVKVVLYR